MLARTGINIHMKALISALFGSRAPQPAATGEVVLNRHFTGDPKAHAALATVIRSLAVEAANQNSKAVRHGRDLIAAQKRRSLNNLQETTTSH